METISNISSVTKKGQVKIPKIIRDKLGIGQGDKDRFVFLEKDGKPCLMVEPVSAFRLFTG